MCSHTRHSSSLKHTLLTNSLGHYILCTHIHVYVHLLTDNLNLKLCSVSEPIVQCHAYQEGDQMQKLQSRV